jgi:hypothetical protein
MICSTSCHHVIILVYRSWPHLLFTVDSVHRRQVHDLPFTLETGPSSQASSWSSPPWSHDSMSCLIYNELLYHHMCEPCTKFKPSSPSWHMSLAHMYLWTNHLCISHQTQLVHLGCHSITKTKQDLSYCPTHLNVLRPNFLMCAGVHAHMAKDTISTIKLWTTRYTYSWCCCQIIRKSPSTDIHA